MSTWLGAEYQTIPWLFFHLSQTIMPPNLSQNIGCWPGGSLVPSTVQPKRPRVKNRDIHIFRHYFNWLIAAKNSCPQGDVCSGWYFWQALVNHVPDHWPWLSIMWAKCIPWGLVGWMGVCDCSCVLFRCCVVHKDNMKQTSQIKACMGMCTHAQLIQLVAYVSISS